MFASSSKGNTNRIITCLNRNCSKYFPLPYGSKISSGAMVGIVIAAVCFVFLIVGILFWQGCLRHKDTMEQDLKGLDLKIGSFTLRQIKAVANNFDPTNKIGEGGFGSVYKVIYN